MPTTPQGSAGRLRRRVLPALTATVATAVLLAACSSTGGKPDSSGSGGGGAGQANTPRVTIAMVTHAPPGDTFFDIVRAGAQAAADKDNVNLQYSSDPQAPNQANLLQTAIDSKVDGIALTLPSASALAGGVKNAQAAGIPISGFNAGFDDWQALGIKEYFGQNETLAGNAAGERLTQDGAKHVVCVIQAQGQVQLESRCAGTKAKFNGQFETLNVNGEDMTSVASTLTAKLQQDPSIDAVLTLGAPIAMTAVDVVGRSSSSAKIYTFDTNAALVDAIKQGKVQWAIDQQPYLQGYLAVDSLWLEINNGNIIGGGGATLTGPAFIDQSNIDSVADYAKAGTR
ncbi:substrate-binding domain-containing protein [Gordonia rhizosphera]|uniref:Putative ABC transporter substrate-binding protein n=1 Tax=Gordonia rhizosphera NBRC 16068 TaxID=1108045 RepID=K6WAS1_9ACTN|nr:substrate-binding domain-containing protein [Gordonia rhizosphera]GAB90841.1 putative ABC transporter substrate-binding protein [Gordonia rhizosphera NBRC 16068]